LFLSYHEKPLFHDFHLTLPANQWSCLLGPSGIGKTTLLRIIAHLPIETQENHFSVSIKISDQKPLNGRIAYMTQSDTLLPWLTVLENVLIEYRLRGNYTSKKIIRSQAMELLDRVGLSSTIDQYPSTLSGGMRQRVSLVRTLLGNHPIVLMDEPFSALDAITRFHLQNLASQLLTNKTILLVTHDPLEAIRLADTIHVLSNAPATILSTINIPDSRPRDLSEMKWSTIQSQLFNTLNQAYEAFYAK
jgi:putative hydroxymethylpyrimidine transport system ATP-binding protein